MSVTMRCVLSVLWQVARAPRVSARGSYYCTKTANAKCLIFVLNAGAQRSDKARYCARLNDDLCGNGQRRQAAGVAASKVIRVPVPMAAFGGKADMVQT